MKHFWSEQDMINFKMNFTLLYREAESKKHATYNGLTTLVNNSVHKQTKI